MTSESRKQASPSSRVYRGINYRHTYHPEFGGYVWQVNYTQLGMFWLEPFVREAEAKAYIDQYREQVGDDR